MKKSFLKIGLVAVSLALFVGCSDGVVTPNNDVKPLPDPDWETYTNNDLGISFNYPKGWIVTEDPNKYDTSYTVEIASKEMEARGGFREGEYLIYFSADDYPIGSSLKEKISSQETEYNTSGFFFHNEIFRSDNIEGYLTILGSDPVFGEDSKVCSINWVKDGKENGFTAMPCDTNDDQARLKIMVESFRYNNL